MSRTQSLVLAAAAQWPLTYTVWTDAFTQAHLDLPNGIQVVKSAGARGLMGRGPLAVANKEGDDLLEVTPAGHEVSKAIPAAVVEVSTPGWRLISTHERRTEFSV